MKKYMPSILFFICMIGVWELMVKLFQIKEYILPAPSRIAYAMGSTCGLLWQHGLHTAFEALLGFILALLTGLGLALIMGLLPGIKRVLYPLIVISQTIPIIAIAPLLIIWFGYGLLPKVIVVALVCFFPVTVSLVEGLSAIDPDMVRLLLAMGASRWQVFWKAEFPGAMPALFAGLKIAAAYSVMGAVIGEWLGSSLGLGIYMKRSMHSFLTGQVFASIVVISFLSLLFFIGIEVAARLLLPWNYPKKEPTVKL